MLSRTADTVTCGFYHLTDFGAMFKPPKFNLPSFAGVSKGEWFLENVLGAILALSLLGVVVFTCTAGIKDAHKVMRAKKKAFYEPHAITHTVRSPQHTRISVHLIFGTMLCVGRNFTTSGFICNPLTSLLACFSQRP